MAPDPFSSRGGGHLALVDDESRFCVFSGGSWTDLFALISALQNLLGPRRQYDGRRDEEAVRRLCRDPLQPHPRRRSGKAQQGRCGEHHLGPLPDRLLGSGRIRPDRIAQFSLKGQSGRLDVPRRLHRRPDERPGDLYRPGGFRWPNVIASFEGPRAMRRAEKAMPREIASLRLWIASATSARLPAARPPIIFSS